LSEPESFNAFKSIEELLSTDVEDIYLPAYFWEQSDLPSPWNIYWTEAAAYREGLEINNPVFGNSWTRYWGAHSWFDCITDIACWSKRHNCDGTHETEGHALAAAATG
jgi:hypothetical protein